MFQYPNPEHQDILNVLITTKLYLILSKPKPNGYQAISNVIIT